MLLLRARAEANPNEAARLNSEVDAALAARAAGESLWGSELPPLCLQQVLEYLKWEPAVCGVMRAVCSTWSSLLDALLPRLQPRRSLAVVMEGKLGWYQSVTEVDLTQCEEEDVPAVLAEVGRIPSLRSLMLPSFCAERAVDAEAVCGLTTLTTLRFVGVEYEDVEYDEDDELVEPGALVLDLSRLTTLTCLDLKSCSAVTDEQVQALSHLTGLSDLNLTYRAYAANEELRAVSSLTALTALKLSLPASCAERAVDAEVVYGLTMLTSLRFYDGFVEAAGEWVLDLRRLTTLTCLILDSCPAVTDEQVLALSNLTGLTVLNLCGCNNVTAEGLSAVSSLTALTTLYLTGCRNVEDEVLCAMRSLTAVTTLSLTCCDKLTDEGLRAVCSLTALSTLYLARCPNLTAAGLRSLSSLTALSTLHLSFNPNVTDEVLRSLSSLSDLSTLYLYGCPKVTAAAKQALSTAIPKLTIVDV
jgi:hypothetical protein